MIILLMLLNLQKRADARSFTWFLLLVQRRTVHFWLQELRCAAIVVSNISTIVLSVSQ